MRGLDDRHTFDAYAHGRGAHGGRPWMSTIDTLNSAGARMIQHEAQVCAFKDRHVPEPKSWPA